MLTNNVNTEYRPPFQGISDEKRYIMESKPRKRRGSSQSRALPLSVPSKKPKNNEQENEALQETPCSHSKRTKTTYSFTTNNKTTTPSNPLRTIKLDGNIPSISSNIIPFSPNHDARSNELGSDDVIWYSPKHSDIKIGTSINHQASQESQHRETGSNNIPSSPLRLLKNTPMKDLTGKYGIKFDNLGSASLKSAKDDGGESQAQESSEIDLPVASLKDDAWNWIKPRTPFTTPLNSKKASSTISKKSSDLMSLINSATKSSVSSSLDSHHHETPSKSQLKPALPTERALLSEQSSSKTTTLPVVPISEPPASKNEDTKTADVSDYLNSDDDEEFLELIRRKKIQTQTKAMTQLRLQSQTQTTRLQTTLVETTHVSNTVKTEVIQELQLKTANQTESQSGLNTQQRNIRAADAKGHLTFKRDIEDSQSDAFQYKEEEVNKAQAAVLREGVNRFEIRKIIATSYPKKDGTRRPQKILLVRDHENQETRLVVRGFSQDLDFEEGDVIHVVGENFKLVDDDTDNVLIWNPDVLLPATLIADTINCSRRSVIKQRLDFNGDYTVPLIIGEVIHHVFQGVLASGKCDMNMMKALMNEAIAERQLTILIIQQLESEVRTLCEEHLPYIKTWFDCHYKEVPDHRSMIKINNTKKRVKFSASNIVDVEESILSHVYGLRGYIDVTIEAHLKNATEDRKLVVPLELKSGGWANVSHEAQASFYTLMMRDRYEMNVEFFMLVYSKLAQTTINEVNNRQIKELIALRNKLSHFMRDDTRTLPPPVKQDQCTKCFVKTECMTYYNLMEDGKEDDSVLPHGMFTELTGHLTGRHREFFNYWDDLITKEDSVAKIVAKELFLIDSATREKAGKCIGHLVIDSIRENDQDQKFIYTFKRADTLKFGPIGGGSTTQIQKHDKVHISDESGSFSLSTGWVVAVTNEAVQVSTNKRLNSLKVKLKNFDASNNQTFQTHLKALLPTQEVMDDSQAVFQYRIDKDEMFAGMRRARTNIMNLFLSDQQEGDPQRRRLIVDQEPPKFTQTPSLPYNVPLNTFNKDQIAAFDRVLSADDYALILGMPGTGKTTVIAQLIRFLVENGKTVLLTSYTHSAVDNILIKLLKSGIDIVRLGSSLSRIHPDVRNLSPLTKDIKTNTDLEEVYFKPPVVATTCLSINDWIFNRRRFDYCIVDESSQVSMPVCLGPLKFCDKFVLVGDHYQLPPLVSNPKAKGLSRSLFKTLSEQFPQSVVDLTYQYRMCDDIMLLTNTIIYEGRLKCGSEEVANQSLLIPQLQKLNEHLADPHLPTNKRWLDTVLDEKRKVLFLNHDKVGDCQETKYKNNIENTKEAELIRQIVEGLLACGVSEDSIGIMSFYRAQLRRLNRTLASHPNIEKLTADQFQGRDKDCIIISLVKSNVKNDAGSLLREWRRVNVAITRARSKLIIVGSKRTLQSLDTISAFLDILHTRGWSYDLPFEADKFYKFSGGEVDDQVETDIASTLNRSVKDLKIVEKTTLVKEIVEDIEDDDL